MRVRVDDLAAQVTLKAVHHSQNQDDFCHTDGDHKGTEGTEHRHEAVQKAKQGGTATNDADDASDGQQRLGAACCVTKDRDLSACASLKIGGASNQQQSDREERCTDDRRTVFGQTSEGNAIRPGFRRLKRPNVQPSGRMREENDIPYRGLFVSTMANRSMPMPSPASGRRIPARGCSPRP